MKILLPKGERIALHADNMTIKAVSVDGESAEFEHFPHCQVLDDERWSSVSCSKSAADAACLAYLSSLSREIVPNLIILCNRSTKSTSEQGEQENDGNIVQNSSEEQIVNGCNGFLEEKVTI